MKLLVVDASAIAEVLLNTPNAHAIAQAMGDDTLVAPAHIVVEVASVVRGWLRSDQISAAQSARILREFPELGITTIDPAAILEHTPRWWANVSAYDAFYVALAEAYDCELLTLDAKLARAVAGRVVVRDLPGVGPAPAAN